MSIEPKTEARSIRLNGRETAVNAGTLDALLEETGHGADRKGIAVALNGEVVPRGRWHETRVASGDEVEIVGAVQGG